ncbi:MAG TPA: hypothetical protein VMC84_01595 [Methanocella sp.]|uniref:hypothetical protein n=1 Tax=Methanocella sp. TaxID=2052833 RepID=UPI002C3FA5E6|nr:hypothetical protein [Methanocella sp.]HTY89847.1 hypothetical protein [Methanocella sp.]
MKLTFSPWSAALGLLVLLMIASILGLVPYVTPISVFWLVVTVFCLWAIKKIFFSEKKG